MDLYEILIEYYNFIKNIPYDEVDTSTRYFLERLIDDINAKMKEIEDAKLEREIENLTPEQIDKLFWGNNQAEA